MIARRGFTMIETLMAALLLCVIFFLLMNLYPSSLLGLRKAHDMTAAADLAQQVLEQKRLVPWKQLTAGTTLLPDTAFDGVTFHERCVISDRNARVKDIAVTVTWSVQQATSAASATGTATYQTSVYRFTNP